MSGTNNEALSMKERTKAKFDQLFKAALEDVKGDGSKKKRLAIEKKETQEALHESYYIGSELNKLNVKTKQKEDKEGLINAGFNENEGQLENKPPKNSLPAVFSKSPTKLESKKKKQGDVIELVPCGNVNSVMDNTGKKMDVETKNFVNSADPDATIGERHPMDMSAARKPRKKKKHKGTLSPSANSATCTEGNEESFKEDVSKHRNREGTMMSKLTDDVTCAAPVEVAPQTSKADGDVHAKETFFSPKKKPRKKKIKEEVTEPNRSNSMQNEQFLSVKIHRVDRLKMNVMIKHPLVRVHIVNGNTGAYIKRKRGGDTPTHDNTKGNVEHILPVMTKPFNLKEKRSVLPVWEEVLHFNESFEYLILEETNAILFFEVLDFLPMSAASSQYSKLGAESGWYHIAWAFLKIVGANKKLNVDRRLQLQLYFPPKHRIRPEPRVSEVFNWWASCLRVPYPATLYVTVAGMDPPVIMQPTPFSSVNAHAGICVFDPKDSKSQLEEVLDARRDSHQQWSRLPGQSCKVPNKLWLSLKTALKGCLVADFSRNGKLIACGCHNNDTSPILIYEIPSGELLKKFLGHSSLIYELKFSATDDSLLSASADGTARVWSMQSSKHESVKVLPHPSYVYTAQFHPLTRSIVVTGCYDTVIRIWNISTNKENQLIKELERHNAYINSICFNEDGTKMYSGDSKGVVHIWDVPSTKSNKNGASGDWNLCKTVSCPELANLSVSKLVHHPKLDRLIIQTQDGLIRILDEESSQVLQRYKGHLNICDYLRCCITPCGNFIFTGSEDHCVYAWNTVTGVQAAIYSDLPHRQTIHCVAFHPLDHFVAFCSFGSNLPVLIYKYDPLVGQLGVSRVQPQDALQVDVPIAALDSSFKSQILSPDSSRHVSGFELHATTSTTRLETIIKKLDSVLDISAASTSFQGLDVPEATNMSWGSTFNGLGINPSAPILKEVVAQFDYNPQRSDELPFKQGDIVAILDMESDQWWIGRLPDGRNGYVPAKFFDTNEHDGDGNILYNHTKDILNVEEKQRNVTALLTKDGELTFMSASDEENPLTTSTPIKRQRRRRRKERDTDGVSQC